MRKILFVYKDIKTLWHKITNKELLRICVFGFYIHILLVFAVFSLYFSSPVEEGMDPIKSTNYPSAKRLVLFVADGLYADAIYDRPDNAPYLTQIRETRGSWGISRTRVPTESRPGHVAILAGMYEDPSAIFKGWQANPVDFDSVINQSSTAWCWGSPEIVGIFNKDNSPHIHTYSYDGAMEDFGSKNTSALDLWVFNKVQNFVLNEWKNLNQSGVVFFLHLLGIDTAGHGYKPKSNEYKNNIKIVDEHINKIENLIERQTGDKKTVYILTSDHGMTDWGAHGAGSLRETETPFIAWGAGIRSDGFREDISQVDIAPLIASLVGINFPINSIGRIPHNFLDLSFEERAKLLLKNADQLLETFSIKQNRIRDNTLIYLPYKGLTTEYFENKILNLYHSIGRKNPDTLIQDIQNVMEVLADGMEYYHYYYQKPILFAITIGLIGWLLYLGIGSLCNNVDNMKKFKKTPTTLFYILLSLTVLLVFAQKMPFSYYFYFTFPVIVWYNVYSRFNYIFKSPMLFSKIKSKRFIFLSFYFLCGIFVYAKGFYIRQLYFMAIYLCLGWYFLTDLPLRKYKCSLLTLLCISLFFFLPIINTKFYPILFLIQTAVLEARLWYLNQTLKQNQLFSKSSLNLMNFQLALTALAAIFSVLVHIDLIKNDSKLKIVSILLSVLPVLIIPYTSNVIFARILSIIEGFLPFYLLMSTNFELFFLMLFIEAMLFWFKAELTLKSWDQYNTKITRTKFGESTPIYQITGEENFRNGFFFMSMILVGFFGTGNIASLNSFDPMWTRCFLTVFSPFKMTILIVLKIIVPFVFTCVILRAINNYCKRELLGFFRVILIMSDLMMLYFLYNVTNIGSWLDIGMSLSHFLIMNFFVIVILLLYGASYYLTITLNK